jgi:hypothetical protein
MKKTQTIVRPKGGCRNHGQCHGKEDEKGESILLCPDYYECMAELFALRSQRTSLAKRKGDKS